MPHDGHDHLSSSGHPFRKDNDTPLTYWQLMEISVRELMITKGEFSSTEINKQIEIMDARTPANGSALVARAWSDPEFKKRLLKNGAEAARELGFDIGPMHLIAVENTEHVHNLIVCTLCSCYPRNLLGFPPDWYKTKEYRSRAVKEPRSVLEEFGLVLPAEINLRVHDSTADMRYIVLPMRPKWTHEMNENDLARLISRDSMIGTSIIGSNP
ncbi:MAG: nitrile hydratase subunit alpha [Proteobacteria bacterium]|jgi:nitrile hydratase|nr:nitrile hydratase subunit alpha [Pseudomonadota bacterium]